MVMDLYIGKKSKRKLGILDKDRVEIFCFIFQYDKHFLQGSTVNYVSGNDVAQSDPGLLLQRELGPEA